MGEGEGDGERGVRERREKEREMRESMVITSDVLVVLKANVL